jgi:hypothetical protein
MRRIIGGKLPRLGMKAKLASTNSHQVTNLTGGEHSVQYNLIVTSTSRNLNYWPSEIVVGAVVGDL